MRLPKLLRLFPASSTRLASWLASPDRESIRPPTLLIVAYLWLPMLLGVFGLWTMSGVVLGGAATWSPAHGGFALKQGGSYFTIVSWAWYLLYALKVIAIMGVIMFVPLFPIAGLAVATCRAWLMRRLKWVTFLCVVCFFLPFLYLASMNLGFQPMNLAQPARDALGIQPIP